MLGKIRDDSKEMNGCGRCLKWVITIEDSAPRNLVERQSKEF